MTEPQVIDPRADFAVRPALPRSRLRGNGSIGRNSAVVSIGLLVTNLLSVAQALLVLFIVGPSESTDAFLSVYALYAPFGLLGATLRRSLVPLIGTCDSDDEFRAQSSEVSSRVLLYARAMTVGLLIISPPIAYLMTHGRPDHVRIVAVLCLVALALAAYFQLSGGAYAGVLNAMSRFSVSTALYALGSIVAVTCSAILCTEIGVVGAALGVLAGSAVFATGHRLYLRRFRIRFRTHARWFREREQHRLGFRLIAGAALTAALQFNLVIALSAVNRPPGEATIYSYTYYIVALMLNLSAASLSVVIMPSLIEEISVRGRDAVRDRIVTVVPFAFFILVPLMMAFALFGRPLLGAAFGSSLSHAQLTRMYSIGLVLEMMLLFAALYALAGSLLLALGKWRVAMYVALATVAVQAAMVYPAAASGSRAVAAAHAGATAVATIMLLVTVFGRRTASVLRQIVAGVAPAFLLASVFLLVRLPLGLQMTSGRPSPAVACAAAAAALVAYLAISTVAWPRVAVPVIRVVGKQLFARS